jgi:hypothetical protein
MREPEPVTISTFLHPHLEAVCLRKGKRVRGICKRKWMGLIVILGAGFAATGCGKTTVLSWYTWLDPTAQIAAGEQSDVVPVVTQVDPLEDVHETLPNSEPPTVEDLSWSDDDYLVGPRDFLTIQIKDLYMEGQLMPLDREVSDDGFIMLPEIPDRVKVSDMTVDQVRQAIIRAYRAR